MTAEHVTTDPAADALRQARHDYAEDWRTQRFLWLLAELGAIYGELRTLGVLPRWLVFMALWLVTVAGSVLLAPGSVGGRLLIGRRANRIARREGGR